MKKTNILVNTARKVVNMSVSGKMTPEDAKAFLVEYNTKMSAIRGSEYTLEIDCTTMQVLTPDLTQDLTGVMQLYKSTGFKKILIIVSNNAVLKMQLGRLIRNTSLTQAEIIEK